MLAGRELWKDADVILVVGTRASQPLTAWGADDDWTLIQMDVDPEEIGRNLQPTIGILADAKAGLTALVEGVAKQTGKHDSREDELRALQQKMDDLLHEISPQSDFADAVRAQLPDDGILVSESTQVGYWSSNGFPVYNPRTYLTSGYQGTLGYGFATALGAQVGNPDKRVISINGDGGFMYNVQELSTAVMHKIPLTTIVFNDGAFGNVKRIQQENYRGRPIASGLYNPDFVKLAESFGMLGIRTETPDGLQDAIKQAFMQDGPALIEVPVGPMPNPGRVTGWGAPPKKHRKD
jgi:acetolactate synthase-1/2/3 large subunit